MTNDPPGSQMSPRWHSPCALKTAAPVPTPRWKGRWLLAGRHSEQTKGPPSSCKPRCAQAQTLPPMSTQLCSQPVREAAARDLMRRWRGRWLLVVHGADQSNTVLLS